MAGRSESSVSRCTVAGGVCVKTLHLQRPEGGRLCIGGGCLQEEAVYRRRLTLGSPYPRYYQLAKRLENEEE